MGMQKVTNFKFHAHFLITYCATGKSSNSFHSALEIRRMFYMQQSQPKGIRTTWQTLPQLENDMACVPRMAYPMWHVPCGFPNTEFGVGTLSADFSGEADNLKKKKWSHRMVFRKDAKNEEIVRLWGGARPAIWPQNTCWEVGRVGPLSSTFFQFPYHFIKAEGRRVIRH